MAYNNGILVTDASGNDVFGNNRESFTGFQSSITSDHSYIHAGKGYKWNVSKALTAEAVYIYEFTTPAAATAYIHWRPVFLGSSANAVTLTFIEGGTYTGGSAMTNIYNKNRNSSNTSGVSIKEGLTESVAGTQLDSLIAGSGSTSARTGGGAEGSEDEWVLKPATKYYLKLTVAAVTNTTIQLSAFWYEESTGV